MGCTARPTWRPTVVRPAPPSASASAAVDPRSPVIIECPPDGGGRHARGRGDGVGHERLVGALAQLAHEQALDEVGLVRREQREQRGRAGRRATRPSPTRSWPPARRARRRTRRWSRSARSRARRPAPRRRASAHRRRTAPLGQPAGQHRHRRERPRRRPGRGRTSASVASLAVRFDVAATAEEAATRSARSVTSDGCPGSAGDEGVERVGARPGDGGADDPLPLAGPAVLLAPRPEAPAQVVQRRTPGSCPWRRGPGGPTGRRRGVLVGQHLGGGDLEARPRRAAASRAATWAAIATSAASWAPQTRCCWTAWNRPTGRPNCWRSAV